ncbi:MAG TPA: hypothetical protein VF453_09800, partial [Burkholderiaceae bacterium]
TASTRDPAPLTTGTRRLRSSDSPWQTLTSLRAQFNNAVLQFGFETALYIAQLADIAGKFRERY